MNHTPEPWEVRFDKESIPPYSITNSSDYDVADVYGWTLVKFNESKPSIEVEKANAARIVACVNGCAGLDPDAYREVVEALEEARDMIERLPHPGNWAIMVEAFLEEKLRPALAHAEPQTPRETA